MSASKLDVNASCVAPRCGYCREMTTHEPHRARLVLIAEHAGVSRATVSRVLSGRGGVSERSQKAVLAAMDHLNFDRPERLRLHSAGLVGLVVPRLDDPTMSLLAQVISSELSRRRYTPLLCLQGADGPDEDEHVTMLRERGVAGIVFVSGLHSDPELDPVRYQALVSQQLPIVLVNGHRDDVDAPSITCDHRVAGVIATSHLRELGHEHIGLISARERLGPVQAQLEGYRQALAEPGRSPAPAYETSTPIDGIDGGYAGARRLLSAGVTGIVCQSDLIALGAIQAVHQVGLTVPREISVVGYGDSMLMNHTGPPLTTVRQRMLVMGRAAAESILDEIHGRRAPRGETLVQPELVTRSTTGRRLGADQPSATMPP